MPPLPWVPQCLPQHLTCSSPPPRCRTRPLRLLLHTTAVAHTPQCWRTRRFAATPRVRALLPQPFPPACRTRPCATIARMHAPLPHTSLHSWRTLPHCCRTHPPNAVARIPPLLPHASPRHCFKHPPHTAGARAPAPPPQTSATATAATRPCPAIARIPCVAIARVTPPPLQPPPPCCRARTACLHALLPHLPPPTYGTCPCATNARVPHSRRTRPVIAVARVPALPWQSPPTPLSRMPPPRWRTYLRPVVAHAPAPPSHACTHR
jgi:hypothetical protein